MNVQKARIGLEHAEACLKAVQRAAFDQRSSNSEELLAIRRRLEGPDAQSDFSWVELQRESLALGNVERECYDARARVTEALRSLARVRACLDTPRTTRPQGGAPPSSGSAPEGGEVRHPLGVEPVDWRGEALALMEHASPELQEHVRTGPVSDPYVAAMQDRALRARALGASARAGKDTEIRENPEHVDARTTGKVALMLSTPMARLILFALAALLALGAFAIAEDYQCRPTKPDGTPDVNGTCSATITTDGKLVVKQFRRGDVVSTGSGWIVDPDDGWLKIRKQTPISAGGLWVCVADAAPAMNLVGGSPQRVVELPEGSTLSGSAYVLPPSGEWKPLGGGFVSEEPTPADLALIGADEGWISPAPTGLRSLDLPGWTETR